jgi:hypothetical protein
MAKTSIETGPGKAKLRLFSRSQVEWGGTKLRQITSNGFSSAKERDLCDRLMKTLQVILLTVLVGTLTVAPLMAADAPPKKLTCCQAARAKGKECTNKCCIAAHKKKESCKRCNPNGEDLPKPAPKQGKPAGKS